MNSQKSNNPKFNVDILKEIGALQSTNLLEKYFERLLYGPCYVRRGNILRSFFYPDDKKELHRYLEKTHMINQETIVDLSPVAICLIINNNLMYVFQGVY